MLREHRRTWPTLALFFQNSCIAHVSVNWLSPVKVRQTFIGGSRKMIVYDDVEATDKIKVYDKGITVNGSAEAAHQLKIGYRAGDMWAPHLPAKEALQTEIEHFVDCVCTGACPISNGITGLQVVRILEAASRSIQAQGNPVRLGGGSTHLTGLTNRFSSYRGWSRQWHECCHICLQYRSEGRDAAYRGAFLIPRDSLNSRKVLRGRS